MQGERPAAAQAGLERQLPRRAVVGHAELDHARHAVVEDAVGDVEHSAFDASAGDRADDPLAVPRHRGAEGARGGPVDADHGRHDELATGVQLGEEAIRELKHDISVTHSDVRIVS